MRALLIQIGVKLTDEERIQLERLRALLIQIGVKLKNGEVGIIAV